MGLKRIGKNYYLYESVRENGKVRSPYVARSHTAIMRHGLQKDFKLLKDMGVESSKTRRALVEAGERELIEWCRTVEKVARLFLIAAGYHQHKRGEWRKRRVPSKTTQTPTQEIPIIGADQNYAGSGQPG